MKYRYVLEFETDEDLTQEAIDELEARLNVQVEVLSDGDLDCRAGRIGVQVLGSELKPKTEGTR